MNAEHLLSVGILTKWHTKSLENFTNDAAALKRVERYLLNYKTYKAEGVGMYLFGANGTGKTLLLNSVMKELLNKRERVRVISFTGMINQYLAGWKDRAVINEIKNVPWLGIDELGKEFKAKDSDLVRTVLDDIIRYRLQMNRPTIITTNTDPTAIKTHYNDDIASMLRENSIIIQVKGPDYRELIHDKINEGY